MACSMCKLLLLGWFVNLPWYSLAQVSDARLWEIAEYIGLKNTLEDFPEGLHTTVSVRGGNWSAGQRQLMCISRAIVNNTGVVIFDEATANVWVANDLFQCKIPLNCESAYRTHVDSFFFFFSDQSRDLQTDALIRQLIQTQLREAAVIVIAHRLEDIISCHRAVVMDAGHIVEDGEPSQLLLDEDSQLLRFVRELGPDLEEQLRQECGCYKKWWLKRMWCASHGTVRVNARHTIVLCVNASIHLKGFFPISPSPRFSRKYWQWADFCCDCFFLWLAVDCSMTSSSSLIVINHAVRDKSFVLQASTAASHCSTDQSLRVSPRPVWSIMASVL